MSEFVLEVVGAPLGSDTSVSWWFQTLADPIDGFPVGEMLILRPGNFERHAFGKETVTGAPEVDFGKIDLDNSDHSLDGVVTAATDGHPLRLWMGPDGANRREQYAPHFTGTARLAQYANRVVSLTIRNRQEEISQRPLQGGFFAGDNVGSTGAEGTDNDLGGRWRPVWLGYGENVPAPMVNTVTKIIQLSSNDVIQITGAAPISVMDNGVAATGSGTMVEKTDWAVFTDPVTGPSGEIWWHASTRGWFIRLASSPAGTVTVTAQEGTAVDSTAAQLVERILRANGLAAGEIDGVDVLHAQHRETVGLWAGTDEVRVGDAIAELLSGAVATWTNDRNQSFCLQRLEVPDARPDHVFLDDDLLKTSPGSEGFRILAGGGPNGAIPPSEIAVKYRKNYQVQQADDLASAATDEHRAVVGQEYRSTGALETGTKSRHLLAKPYERRSLLSLKGDADALLARLVALFGVRRFIVAIDLEPEDAAAVRLLADTVSIPIGRFDFDTRMFRVIGVVDDLGGPTSLSVTTLILWG